MGGPLDGFRVVEIAEGVAGPYTAMALGDAGADVIKIEAPEGDRARGWGPPLQGDTSAVFLSLNRNKRGITLDLTNEAGIASARALLMWADVAVVDPRCLTGTALNDTLIATLNPRLVWCVLSGYGPEGPWADRPAGELPAQMAAEATSSLGGIGAPPVRMGTDIASMYAANYAIQAICAALLERESSGQGQRIEVSLFGSILAMRSTLWVALSNPDEWWGFHVESYTRPPDHGYRCKNGAIFFSLARMDRERFDTLIHDLRMDWVRADPLFPLLRTDAGGGTSRYAPVMRPLWERAFAEFTQAELLEMLGRHGATVFPMNDYAALTAHPQTHALNLIETIDQPGVGPMRVVAPPWEFAETPASIRRPAPRLGEHTAAVLAEVGTT